MNEIVFILLMISSGVFMIILNEYGVPIIDSVITSFVVFGIIGFLIGWIYSV